ncbi:MAG: class I tRNA ligase family protein [Thiotrichaceae bacterium]
MSNITAPKREVSYIVTMPPPTPNGGLHVGHMAGPFLAADVFAKTMSILGNRTHVVSFSDTNQSYVRATAEKQNTDPCLLASKWSTDIVRTLNQYNCKLDFYFEPDPVSNAFCRDQFLSLYDKSILVKKPFPFFYSTARNTFIDEAGASGLCPECLDNCKCGICESCGLINRADTLLFPYDTNSPDLQLEVRHVDVLVIELERWRKQLTEFHSKNPHIRPKYSWLIEDVLARELPNFPISVPGTWGIGMDRDEFKGQVLNAWPEILTNFMYAYRRYEDTSPHDGIRIVNFFGFDNSYFYAIVHIALLHAFEETKYLPHSTMTNEFYNLNHDKFSTSKNHVIWASDIAKRILPDIFRMYAAITAPGYEKSNFSEKEMLDVFRSRFSDVWDELALKINAIIDQTQNFSLFTNQPSKNARKIVLAIHNRALKHYQIEQFNMREGAESALRTLPTILHYIDSKSGENQFEETLTDICHLLAAFAESISPITPELCLRITSNIEEIRAGRAMLNTKQLLRHDRGLKLNGTIMGCTA